jgi:indolepyruvate ferredoxin oxidoreductase, beta subunit
VAFEELEGIRWAEYLKPGGKLVVNRLKIFPSLVTSGAVVYPDNLIELARSQGLNPIVIDASSVAKKMGNALYLNMLMLGYVSNFFKVPMLTWENAVSQTVLKYRDENWQAFLKGRDMREITA